MKRAIAWLLLLLLTGCGAAASVPEVPASPPAAEAAAPGEAAPQPSDEVSSLPETPPALSLDIADYGITAEMCAGEVSPDLPSRSTEALCAFLLHADGAIADSGAEELYQRFLADPGAVLYTLGQLGSQPSPIGGGTAAEALCREIAWADVFWYDGTEAFAEILRELSSSDGSGSTLLACLEAEHTAALAAQASSPPPEEVPASTPSPADFVRVQDLIADIAVELRYATEDNFTGAAIYEFSDAYLRLGTARRLAAAQALLAEQGCGLKIWDAFRPTAAQFRLWEVCPDSRYVADPEKGFSSHSRGSAVDVTLVDAEGNELAMPTAFDDFTPLADRDWSDVSDAAAAANAQRLEAAMTAAGFRPYFGEWWHFSDTDAYEVETAFSPGA